MGIYEKLIKAIKDINIYTYCMNNCHIFLRNGGIIFKTISIQAMVN